jgi:hypothetical protein
MSAFLFSVSHEYPALPGLYRSLMLKYLRDIIGVSFSETHYFVHGCHFMHSCIPITMNRGTVLHFGQCKFDLDWTNTAAEPDIQRRREIKEIDKEFILLV